MRHLPLALLLLASLASAEEGMWLFNDFPAARARKEVGFAPDQAWLDRVRLGSLRLANGCSASIVSADGLVMTNHHCVRPCLEDLSTPTRDLLETGFVAATRAEEERCAKYEGNQLVAITDVTAPVLAAVKGKAGAEYQKALKAETARLESACAQGDAGKRCDVVTLFHGATFHLYQYRRFQDLRVAFAPEFQMAAFGGYPDNFNFPRYGFDAAFLRLYVDGQPARTPEALRWAAQPVKEGEVVLVSGHPGGTERGLTVAQYELLRDVTLPWSVASLAEARGRLDEWMKQSPDRARVARSRLRSIENSLKSTLGRREALVAPGFLEGKRAEEAALKAKAPPAARGAWDAIARALQVERELYPRLMMAEAGQAFQSDLFAQARRLVRLKAELPRPNAERLREYTEGRLPALRQALLDPTPVRQDLEKARLAWSLARLRDLAGADDPFVRRVLAGQSPEARAAALVEGTRLGDLAARKAALEHPEALDLEADPMLAFAALVDPEARAVRRRHEEEVEAVLGKSMEQINSVRRAAGPTGAPDATFTLRLSYGRVKGVAGQPALTTVGGLFERATGQPPFALAPRWVQARAALDPATPYDLATTNDIIGGNSGSPLLDREGRVVGLIFDGNLPSLGGNFWYEPAGNRAVAVHGELIVTALRQVYGAGFLADELTRQ